MLIASHEPDLLRRLCDEVWWLDAGALRSRGDPGEVLEAYQDRIAEKFRAWGETQAEPDPPVAASAEMGAQKFCRSIRWAKRGKPTMIWRSGEQASVRVLVRYLEPVQEPVIGILIRTRIGLAVYGTNTELEKIKTGKLRSRRPDAGGLPISLRLVSRRIHIDGGFSRRGWNGARLDR